MVIMATSPTIIDDSEIGNLFLFFCFIDYEPLPVLIGRLFGSESAGRASRPRGGSELTGPQATFDDDVARQQPTPFPPACALFPATHNVLKSLGSKARLRLSFTWMQAYIVA